MRHFPIDQLQLFSFIHEAKMLIAPLLCPSNNEHDFRLLVSPLHTPATSTFYSALKPTRLPLIPGPWYVLFSMPRISILSFSSRFFILIFQSSIQIPVLPGRLSWHHHQHRCPCPLPLGLNVFSETPITTVITMINYVVSCLIVTHPKMWPLWGQGHVCLACWCIFIA